MNDCCEDMENRGPVERVSESLSLTRCTVCGARHFELEVDAGVLSGEGAEL